MIAIGFQRDNLPLLARRAAAGAGDSMMPEAAPPAPAPVLEPVMSSGSLFREMPPAARISIMSQRQALT